MKLIQHILKLDKHYPHEHNLNKLLIIFRRNEFSLVKVTTYYYNNEYANNRRRLNCTQGTEMLNLKTKSGNDLQSHKM